MSQPQIAILDDYQQVAFQFADWTPVLAKAKVTFFSDHIDGEAALVERLGFLNLTTNTPD
jgi:hypothetical protein